MSAPEFLTTKELADLLRVKERKIYELASEGEIPCRRVTGKLLFPKVEIDAWLGGTATVSSQLPHKLPQIIAGSHDPLLDWAIRESQCGLATFFDGSLDGIDKIEANQALAAGVHLVEKSGDEWNLSLVRERFSSKPIVLVEWGKRQQGMILSTGLKHIVSLTELIGKRIAQRQPSAGAHQLFIHELNLAGCKIEDFHLMPELFRTETDAAIAVASGAADAAPGLKTLAQQFGLGFFPSKLERYDLIVDRREWFEPPMQTLLKFCNSDDFQKKAMELGGYDLSDHGKIIWNGS